MDYPANLCDLTPLEQAAIENDKALWLDAYRTVRAHSLDEIKHQLELIECEISREDMRRRLNTCYKNTSRINK